MPPALTLSCLSVLALPGNRQQAFWVEGPCHFHVCSCSPDPYAREMHVPWICWMNENLSSMLSGDVLPSLPFSLISSYISCLYLPIKNIMTLHSVSPMKINRKHPLYSNLQISQQNSFHPIFPRFPNLWLMCFEISDHHVLPGQGPLLQPHTPKMRHLFFIVVIPRKRWHKPRQSKSNTITDMDIGKWEKES